MANIADVTCAICFEIWNKPKVTPVCSHIFCAACLEALVASNHEAANSTEFELSFFCPMCRKVNPLPPGGVQELQVNSFLEELVSKMRLEQAEKSREMRKQRASSDWDPMRDVSVQHDAPIVEPRPAFCMEHGILLNSSPPAAVVYCKDCVRLACPDCNSKLHRQHDVIKVSEALELKTEACEVLLKYIEEQIHGYNSTIATGDACLHNVDQQTEEAIERVVTKVNHFSKLLDVVKVHFIALAQFVAQQQTIKLRRRIDKASQQLLDAQLLEKELHDVLRNSDLLEMVIKHRVYQSILAETQLASGSNSPGNVENTANANESEVCELEPSTVDFSEVFAEMKIAKCRVLEFLKDLVFDLTRIRAGDQDDSIASRRKYNPTELLQFRTSSLSQIDDNLTSVLKELGLYAIQTTP